MNFLKFIITILKLIQLGKNQGADTSFSYLKLVLQYVPVANSTYVFTKLS